MFFRDLWQKKPLLVRRHIETYNDGWFSTKELDRILKQVWQKLIQAKLLSIDLPQGCHSQGKSLENDFSMSGKSQGISFSVREI